MRAGFTMGFAGIALAFALVVQARMTANANDDPLTVAQDDPAPAAATPDAKPAAKPVRKVVRKPVKKTGAEEAQAPGPPATPEETKKPPETAAPVSGPTPAQQPAAAAPPAAAPQTPASATGELEPVLHAQNAKVTTCMDTIVGESATVIDSTHTAISTWSNTAPNDNLFQSIVGLSYTNRAAPNAAAIILAVPVGNRCEGQTVQVYPFGQSCSVIQATLIKEGKTIAMLRSLPVIETKGGYRDILMPTSGGGCVVISVGLR